MFSCLFFPYQDVFAGDKHTGPDHVSAAFLVSCCKLMLCYVSQQCVFVNLSDCPQAAERRKHSVGEWGGDLTFCTTIWEINKFYSASYNNVSVISLFFLRVAWNFHRNEKLITIMKSNLRRAKSLLWNIVDEFKFERERIRLAVPLCFLNQSSGYIFHACLFTELEDVVIVIQSQRNSYHARRSGQRKVEILQQAARLGQVTSAMLCYNLHLQS